MHQLIPSIPTLVTEHPHLAILFWSTDEFISTTPVAGAFGWGQTQGIEIKAVMREENTPWS